MNLPPLVLALIGASLAALPPETYRLEKDWLVDPASFKATARVSAEGETLTMDNGLVRRVIRLKSGCATVAVDDLMNGRSLLRATRPEGTVTINGREHAIGGLVGQPNQAYLTPEWLASMRADPKAMRLVNVELGQPRERMAWKRVRPHEAGAAWPPKGVYARLDFAPTDIAATGVERKRLWADDLAVLDKAWVIRASAKDERISFTNEGKVGEIYAPGNVHCYAERPLPPGTGQLELTLSPGTDAGSGWGPGLAVVFTDGTVARVALRPGDRGKHGHASLGVGGSENLVSAKAFAAADGGLDLARTYRLRVTLGTDALVWELADHAEPGRWVSLGRTPRSPGWGKPATVRIGKTSREGGAGDHDGETGEWGRSRIIALAVYDQEQPLAGAAPAKPAFRVSVHLELYDGLPAWSKWITVHNDSAETLTVDRFNSELLAVVEASNHVEHRPPLPLPEPNCLEAETDQAFGSFNWEQANRHAVRWEPDPSFTSQVNYLLKSLCLLRIGPFRGPAQQVAPGGTFESFRAFVLVQDSTEQERRGLSRRKLYRTLAPWVTENPLMHHLLSNDPKRVRQAIDEAAEVGFEMVILSFGSGFNAENEQPAHLASWREVADYARSKGVDLGTYSLLSSRRVGGGNDVVPAPGESTTFGNAPALTSAWGVDYFRKIHKLHAETGFSVFEHDGSYPGDWDVTPRPPLQRGLDDSQWAQWRIIDGFYRWCRGEGIYLNVPDYYFLGGSSKCGMGYREVNWSLPRAQQVIHTRQNIFDGTWSRTPSMGWMFVPLSQYHGGGAAATIEPLDTHLDHYRRMMLSNLAFGVQACYRGPRLFDTPRTREMVRETVAWYKRHRAILESDLVHLRRADGVDWDGAVHVNPKLPERAMLVAFNPTAKPMTREILVPLHYAGLSETCVAQLGEDGPRQTLRLDAQRRARVQVTLPAEGFVWMVFRAP
ncbi:MAG: hypothetical protein ACK5VI_01030 [Opitutia bacterium]|jgi:hypothetical protein